MFPWGFLTVFFALGALGTVNLIGFGGGTPGTGLFYVVTVIPSWVILWTIVTLWFTVRRIEISPAGLLVVRVFDNRLLPWSSVSPPKQVGRVGGTYALPTLENSGKRTRSFWITAEQAREVLAVLDANPTFAPSA